MTRPSQQRPANRSRHRRRYCGHRLYHLTCQQFDALEAESNGRCALCGADPTDWGKGLTIDHDHSVGARAVRGLLCQHCNWHLGRVDIGRVEATEREAAYLAAPWYIRMGLDGACPTTCGYQEHRFWERGFAEAVERVRRRWPR